MPKYPKSASFKVQINPCSCTCVKHITVFPRPSPMGWEIGCLLPPWFTMFSVQTDTKQLLMDTLGLWFNSGQCPASCKPSTAASMAHDLWGTENKVHSRAVNLTAGEANPCIYEASYHRETARWNLNGPFWPLSRCPVQVQHFAHVRTTESQFNTNGTNRSHSQAKSIHLGRSLNYLGIHFKEIDYITLHCMHVSSWQIDR